MYDGVDPEMLDITAHMKGRVVDEQGNVHINLLTSKGRVAPLKNQLTLPRKELAGALLLAHLVQDAVTALDIKNPERFYWCDSQIALAWIRKHPTTWDVFVANRVATIQEKSTPAQWRYVNTKENPADVASRGCTPAALLNHPLWWHGPAWLKGAPETWPCNIECSTDLEIKITRCAHVTTSQANNELLARFSSFSRLVRVTAWILRFKTNARATQRTTSPLKVAELEAARIRVLLMMQQMEYPSELEDIRRGQLPRSAAITSLNPFLDENGLLRVGGRLRNATLNLDNKNPVLLPRTHPLTRSIIKEAHLRTLHGGAQLTMALLRQSYWITNARTTIRGVIRTCRVCQRYAVSAPTQQMGDLPATRVQPSAPFTYTGVDFCGPFVNRCSKGKGIATTKCYVAVFICFSTRAIHLELVSDLSTAAFLAALNRFVARRSLSLEIHSDNGTNFQGASKELTKMWKRSINEATEVAAEYLAKDGITWRYITPYSPHLGGLWEAAVKSTKHHLKRVLTETKLTFEEFTTLLCQVEACLNSRPITPTSSDPEDITALTPGHFLITRPLLAPPVPDELDAKPAQRWDLLKRLHQQFWSRWSAEYLTELQRRTKWRTAREDPEIGTLVLLKDKTLPPAKWALGKITKVHPGNDGHTRLVTIDTAYRKDLKQPLVNLVALPDDNKKDADPKPTANSTEKRTRSSRVYTCQRTPINWIPAMFMLMTMCASINALTIIKPQPGLYVERIGYCQLKAGTLRLQTTIGVEEMTQDEQHLNSLGSTLRGIYMSWYQQHKGSAAEAQQFTQMYHQFEEKRQQIADRIADLQLASARAKRGLFGKLLTAVFGVNDEVYAELNTLHKDQATSNRNILKVSTILERTHHDLAEHRRALEQTLRHSQEVIRKLSVESYGHTLLHHLTAAHINAMTYLTQLYEKYNTLEKAVSGRSSIMDLLTLAQIHKALRGANARLPDGHHVIPVPDQYIETNFTGDGLTVSGFFPITTTEKFDLVHVTPIPEQRNHSFVIQTISARTVALNYNAQLQFELRAEELAACKRIADDDYLCDAPVMSTMVFDKCSLTTEIYNRTGDLPCETTELSISGVLWQKLLMPNTWLYTTNTTTLITSICRTQREDQYIHGTGIVKLEPGCTLRSSQHAIHSMFQLDSLVKQTFIKPSRLSVTNPITKRIDLKDPPPYADPMSLLVELEPLEGPSPRLPMELLHFSPWMLLMLVCGVYGFMVWRKAARTTSASASPDISNSPETTTANGAEGLELRISRLLAARRAPQNVQTYADQRI